MTLALATVSNLFSSSISGVSACIQVGHSRTTSE